MTTATIWTRIDNPLDGVTPLSISGIGVIISVLGVVTLACIVMMAVNAVRMAQALNSSNPHAHAQGRQNFFTALVVFGLAAVAIVFAIFA